MRITAIAIAAGLAFGGLACGGQKDPGAGSAVAPPPPPVTCPPGSFAGSGSTCVVVITPDKITAIAAQKTRVDEVAALLDKVDALTAPIELLNGIRQLDAWKQIAAASDKLQVVDTIVQTLNNAVLQLRAFRGHLGELSQRLGDLRGELDKLIAGTGLAKNLADARAQISTQVRALIQPYAQQTSETIQRALRPLVDQLSDVADLLRGACAMARMSSGSGSQLKDLCAKASDAFTQAQTFLDRIKARPAMLFDEVTNLLVSNLDQLIDDGTREALVAAQEQVDAAIKGPAAGSGSAGSGSAGPGSAGPGSGI